MDHMAQINRLCDGESLTVVVEQLLDEKDRDAWLTRRCATSKKAARRPRIWCGSSWLAAYFTGGGIPHGVVSGGTVCAAR